MFGRKIIKEKEYNALQEEIKGFYAQSNAVNEYIRIISSQLTGVEMGKIGEFSRKQMKDAYEKIAPVTAVVNYIADSVGEVSRYLELRDLKSGEYIDKHPVLDLLNRPNDRFTRRKFFTAAAINKLVFGDIFTYAPKSVGKDRMPVEMYVLPGQRIAIERGGITSPMKSIRLNGGKDSAIDLEGNVFQSFDYNLDDTSFFGTSKIGAAAVYLTIMDRAMNRQATALQNGGVANVITPAGSDKMPPLPSQLDDLEQKTNALKNANKNIAIKTAIEVHKLGDSPVSLDILNAHKDAINVLCFLYKLPVDIFLGQAKYENAKEAKKTVYEQIAIGMANEYAEDLLHYLELDGQYELAVNIEKVEVLKNSAADTLNALEKMHATLNELREANGYARIEEPYADEPILPLGIQFGNETSIDISEE